MTFEKVGFEIVKNLIPVNGYYEIIKSMEDKGNINDPQSPGSPSLYKISQLDLLHELVRLKVEAITGLELFKTYHYLRIYKKGAILKPHTDRPACEISVTLNLGGDDWDIGCFDYADTPHTITLKKGDAMIYHGCDLVHWRPGEFEGKELIQVFLHYVNANGLNAWCKDDINR